MEQLVRKNENTQQSDLESPLPWWAAAIRRQRDGDADSAMRLYQRCLRRNPQDATVWLNLGSLLRRSRRFDAALVCYLRAQRLCPLDAAVWCNMGKLWQEQGQHAQALRCHRRAQELDPARLSLRLEYARALREAGEFVAAEELVESCLEAEPDRPDLRWQRALLRLHMGRYRDAWPDYQAYWQANQQAVGDAPRWRGERIGGKRVLLLAGESVSETLWAARYIPMLRCRGAALTLACDPALHPVLRSLDVELLSPDAGLQQPAFDFDCPLMVLPALVDLRGISIPQSFSPAIPESSCLLMRQRVATQGGALRIGIAWSGSSRFAGHARRAVSLERLLPLATLAGVQLFSLQKGQAAEQLQSSGARAFVADLARRCRDYGDTAAAINAMDLIVTTDGVVAHLAAAIGKPTLNLLQFAPDWIYGISGESTPWYPTMRLIRQQTPGNWDSVFAEVLRLVGKWAARRVRDCGMDIDAIP